MGRFSTVRFFSEQSVMLVVHLHGTGHVGVTSGRKPRRNKRIPVFIFTCKHFLSEIGWRADTMHSRTDTTAKVFCCFVLRMSF